MTGYSFTTPVWEGGKWVAPYGWPVKRLRREVRASQIERSADQPAARPGPGASQRPRIPARAAGADDRAPSMLPVSAPAAGTSARSERNAGWVLLSRRVLHVMEVEMAASAHGRRHPHPSATQVYYMLAGNGTVEVGTTRVTAPAGQATEIGSGDPYLIRNEAERPRRPSSCSAVVRMT